MSIRGSDPDPTLFRGLISGNAFHTKKGAKGVKLDSLWSRQLIESIISDDEELAGIALSSCIADINAVVDGGEEGSPYALGNYGFYTDNAFDLQGQVLQEAERRINEGREYLSDKEWRIVDGKLRRIAQHGTPKLKKAVSGDTIPMLAVRGRAFCVSCFIFDKYKDTDALTENDFGDTLKDVLREYNITATEDLISLNKEIEGAMRGIILPSTAEFYSKRSNELLEEQLGLQRLLRLVVSNLERRLVLIEKHKWEQKKSLLKKQAVEFDVLQSVALEPVALNHISLYKELIEFVDERVTRQRAVMQKNDLDRLVAEQQELLIRVKPVASVTEQMFGGKSTDDHSDGSPKRIQSRLETDAEIDDQTIISSFQGDSISANYTDHADMASVNSVEGRLRDILSEQLISIEQEKELRRLARIAAAENASSKFYVTHDFLEDGHKIFDATEAPVPHGDKMIPTAYVKKVTHDEEIIYK